jgi:hypothetical protein
MFFKSSNLLKNSIKDKNEKIINPSIDRTHIIYSYNITILRLLGESLEKYNLNVALVKNYKISIIRKKMVIVP